MSTQAVRTITTKKIKIEYRSAGRVALEDLDGDVVEEIKSLQAKMHERIEEQRQSQKRTISWLLEEDNLLQKLRLHGFAFTQISRVSILVIIPFPSPSLVISFSLSLK